MVSSNSCTPPNIIFVLYDKYGSWYWDKNDSIIPAQISRILIPPIRVNMSFDISSKRIFRLRRFREANSQTHIIEINEKQYHTKYQSIIRRLIKAGATSSIAQEIEIEDQFLYDLECFERRAEEKATKVIKALKQVKAKIKKDADKAKQKLEEAIQTLIDNGISEDDARKM